MEWLIFAVLIVVLGVASYFYPALKIMLFTATFNFIKSKESEIVLATYNALPKAIKQRVSSKDFAEIIASVLSFGLTAVEKDLTKK